MLVDRTLRVRFASFADYERQLVIAERFTARRNQGCGLLEVIGVIDVRFALMPTELFEFAPGCDGLFLRAYGVRASSAGEIPEVPKA